MRRLRALWSANDKPLARRNFDCERDKALGDGLTVHVQASIDVHVDRQPESLEGAIGGRVKACCNLDALGLGMHWGAAHGTGQAKAPFQDRYARLALAIALLKALLEHIALLVEQEHARVGHPPTLVAFGNAIGGMVLEDIFVEEAEFADHLAALIREEGVGDVLLGSKGGQHVYGVVADGKGYDMMALKVRQTLLQLDELRFTEGSPSGAAVKDDQGTPTVADLVQIDALAVLVRQDDVREALPNRRANLGEVDAKVEGSRHKSSSLSWKWRPCRGP